jgi:LAS superfamily LD-carboxypeptidase LdcB
MSSLHPELARGLAFLQAVARHNGHGLVVTSMRRSRATQRRLYDDFLAGRSKYPAAPPGLSSHERGLAFDAVIQPEALQAAYGRLWESIGGTWGASFNDPIHFELR